MTNKSYSTRDPSYYILVWRRNTGSIGWGWAVFRPGVPMRPDSSYPWSGSEEWGLTETRWGAKLAAKRRAKRLCRPVNDSSILSYYCKPRC